LRRRWRARGEFPGRMVRIIHYSVETGAQPPEGRPEKDKAD
jgi:hypothetical protein